MKFTSGNTYIVTNAEGKWYLVQQISMKSWRAVLFTEPCANHDEVILSGNGLSLPELIDVTEYNVFNKYDKVYFRRTMFNVLKYGSFSDKGL